MKTEGSGLTASWGMLYDETYHIPTSHELSDTLRLTVWALNTRRFTKLKENNNNVLMYRETF